MITSATSMLHALDMSAFVFRLRAIIRDVTHNLIYKQGYMSDLL